jgi:hypothetical protein
MSSDPSFVEFIVEQMNGAGQVMSKNMHCTVKGRSWL